MSPGVWTQPHRDAASLSSSQRPRGAPRCQCNLKRLPAGPGRGPATGRFPWPPTHHPRPGPNVTPGRRLVQNSPSGHWQPPRSPPATTGTKRPAALQGARGTVPAPAGPAREHRQHTDSPASIVPVAATLLLGACSASLNATSRLPLVRSPRPRKFGADPRGSLLAWATVTGLTVSTVILVLEY